MIKLKSLFVGYSQSGDSQSRKQRRRPRTLRLESLDRRELMDGAGLLVDIPSLSPTVSRAEPPAAVASFSAQSASATIVPGSVRNESISRSGEVDRFTFNAAAGQRFMVSLAPNGGMNTTVRVIAPNVRTVILNSTTTALQREVVIPTAGRVAIEVTATNGRSTGTYRIGLESLSIPSLDCKEIIAGSVANGQLSGTIQVDQYRVTAVAGQRFQVALSTQSGLNASFKMIGANGNGIFVQNTATALAREFVAPTAGTYIVQVQATNLTSLGAYRVGIERLSSPSPNARALSVGQVVSGQISERIQADQYKVSARAGQRFRLDLTPLAGLNVRVRVFEPGGQGLVSTSASSARQIDFNARIAGEYTVMIEALGGTSLGNYRLGLRLRA